MRLFKCTKYWRKTCLLLVGFSWTCFSLTPLPVLALNSNDLNSIINNTPFYDPTDTGDTGCQTSASSSAATLVGNDNEQKAFNYFRAKGLDDLHAAAVIGNLALESHLDPEVMQIGGDSQNPYDADSLGWGIAQWSGNAGPRSTGDKVNAIYQQTGVSGPVYALATQLDMVWAEMTGTAPTGYKDLVANLNQQTTLPGAVSFFQVNFESGTDFTDRLSAAVSALQKYGGSPGAVSTSTAETVAATGCGPSSTLSPDCQNANGVAKILCDAKKYDPVSYSETGAAGHQGGAAWHQSCPIIGPSCILDCSGLVNIAVYDVYGVDLREITYSEASDTQYWQHIPLSQVQPGDLVQPGEYSGGHVEIIDHVQGQTLYTFGAHTSSVPQPDQVSSATYQINPGDLYLHYIGPGSQ